MFDIGTDSELLGLPTTSGDRALPGAASDGAATTEEGLSRLETELATELPTERLEVEICTLAGHLAAATCRWLLLVGEFDRREGWRSWEQTSCAGWLSWKCGVSVTTAYEHVRVARALRQLPQTTAEFAAGRLSFSKVRAISRVADATDEDGWVSAALGCTAAQLDRLSRACARVNRAESEGRVLHEKVSWRYDDDGMLIFSARLAPERGARLIAALEQIQHADAEHSAWEGIEPQEPSHPFGRIDPEESDDEEERALMQSADSSAEEFGVESSLVDKDGSASLHASSGSSAEAPEPVPSDRLPSSLSSDHDVELGCGLADALVAMSETVLTHGPRPADAGDIHQVVFHLREDGACHLGEGPSTHPATLRRETYAGATAFTVVHGPDGSPMDAGRTTRKVPPRLRRAVMDRAGGWCQFPGCERKAWLQIHHVQHWVDGGPTSYANLAVLCSHHHRAHHAGRFHMTHDRTPPGHFRFWLPDGTALPVVPESPTPESPTSAVKLARWHTAVVTDTTIQPNWRGDPLRLDHAVWVFTHNRTTRRRYDQAARDASVDVLHSPA